MSRSRKRVSFSPESCDCDDRPRVFLKRSYSIGGDGGISGRFRRIHGAWCSFRLVRGGSSSSTGECSPARFLRRLGAKLGRTLRLASKMRRRRSFLKVSSSSSSSSAATLGRSRSMSSYPAMDSQRAEAVEDCIEFLHNSCSSSCSSSAFFQRSSSISAR